MVLVFPEQLWYLNEQSVAASVKRGVRIFKYRAGVSKLSVAST